MGFHNAIIDRIRQNAQEEFPLKEQDICRDVG
jgi:hypothetical protein